MTLFHHKYGILEMSNEHTNTWINYSTGIVYGAFFDAGRMNYLSLPLSEIEITFFL